MIKLRACERVMFSRAATAVSKREERISAKDMRALTDFSCLDARTMGMARLERVVYRSNCAAVVDVVTYGAEEIALDSGSIAFVRSGYFTKRFNQVIAILDPNYAVFGSASECLLAGACRHICACTIVRFADVPDICAPAGCAIASSRAFLMQAQILTECARRHDYEPALFDLLHETRADAAAVRCAHSRLVTEIRRRLNDSPSRHLPLEVLAAECYTSPFTVSRVFHRETGMRLRDYSSRLRLRKALNLLMHSRKNLTAIAIDLGFYDESHFSKSFRAEFGISPHNVRKY
jgi:AraC-like DNA-binding protein